ncbi:hypothetical protein OG474_15820 [Kribbella sp. NBC_01505]|uniref:hypothetical protein n=1 Tax=Kribbella sp. NBC_01505 TaxID=2903580 RepID=UPI003864E6F8
MDKRTHSSGKVVLQAATVGLAVGLLYDALFQLRVPLCAPSAADCAIDSLGLLFAAPLGALAMALTLLARRPPR